MWAWYNMMAYYQASMNWFFLALLAPFCWSIANYLDKYLLSGPKEKTAGGGSGGLLILSSAMTIIAALLVLWIAGPDAVSLGSQEVGVLVLSGMFEALYILFYFWALEQESTTTVISLAQFAPIMGLIFGFLLLGEVPHGIQILAVVIILVGTLFIISKKGQRFRFHGHILLLMLVSTAFIGLYNTLFKIAGENIPYWTAMFWQYLGIGAVGFLLYFGVPPYRRQTHAMLSKSGSVLAITGAAELMNIFALMAMNAAILLAPVALVLSVSSVQPIFVLIEAAILAAIFPKFFSSSEKPTFMVRYVLGILLVCLGGFLIYQG